MVKTVIQSDQIKEVWRKYLEQPLNEENAWDKAKICEKGEGPCELISKDKTRF